MGPANLTHVSTYDPTNYVVDSTSPVTANMPQTLTGNYASHGYFTNYPANTHVFITDSVGRPTVIEFKYGRGSVFAQTTTAEYYTTHDGPLRPLLQNSISYNIKKTLTKELNDIIREPDWDPDSLKFIVNINGDKVDDFDDPKSLGEIIPRFTNDEINYIGVGSQENQEQTESFIEKINGNGTFVDNDGNESDYADDIVNYIISKMLGQEETQPSNDNSGQYVIVGNPINVSVTPESLLTDTQTPDYPQGRWKIIHDETYFENNTGQVSWSGQWMNNLVLSFDKPGRYEVFFGENNTVPRYFYAHRRPIASFSSVLSHVGNDFSIEIVDHSYDLDLESQEDRGIEEYEWKWKETTDENWTDGIIPENLPLGKDYIVQLRVKDYQGAWSLPESQYITTDSVVTNPISNFTFSGSPVIYPYQNLSVNNLSYDPSGLDLTTTKWTIKRLGAEIVYSGSTIPQDFSNYTASQYTLSLEVQNSAGKWSQPFSRPFTIQNVSVPSAPTNVSAAAGNTTATVSWTKSSNNGGSEITGYTVTSSPDGKTCSVDSGSTNCSISGLVNGRSYTFTVVAKNSAGNSNPSDPSNSVIPATIPQPPTNVTVVAGNGQASISWTPNSNNGGNEVTSYLVEAVGDNSLSCTIEATRNSCVISGLINGQEYSFTVKARNFIGYSSPSNPTSPIIPATVPSSVTDYSATFGNSSSTIDWSLPVFDGGHPIDYFTIESNTGVSKKVNFVEDQEDYSYVFEDLTNGESYSFTISAHNDVGDSESVTTNTVIPATVPSAPLNVGVSRGDSQVTVTWSDPSDNGGHSITGYEVTSVPDSKTCSTSDSETLTCVVSSLENGKTYTFKVRAKNDVGFGEYSFESEPVIPATISDAPTNVTAVDNDGSATVTWDAPEWNGGNSITSYKVTSSDPSKSCVLSSLDFVNGSTQSCIVTGLKNGEQYTFTVTATNEIGESAPSTSSNSITPASVPDKPTNVTVVGGDESVVISWTAPEWEGGSVITGYQVMGSDGSTCSTDGATTCIIKNLTNGNPYTFKVKAENRKGSSEYSDPSSSVTPARTPDAPTDISVERGNGEITVSWNQSSYNGGAAIDSYLVETFDQNNNKLAESCTTDSDGNSCVVEGLTNGEEYYFSVKAHNRVGYSDPVKTDSSIIPGTIPDKPTDVTVSVADSSIVVNWQEPQWNGGVPITKYTVRTYDNAGTLLGQTCETSDHSITSCIVEGLTNGSSYKFTVEATNIIGDSGETNFSDTIIPATVPDAPTNIKVEPLEGSAKISWTAPSWDGGHDVINYIVTGTGSNSDKVCSTEENSGKTDCIVDNLTNGMSYNFVVTAVNDRGNSSSSSISPVVIPYTVPDSPTNVSVERGNSQIKVSWAAPEFDGGRPVTSYTVTSQPDDKTCQASGSETSCVVSDLTNGKQYTFKVHATNLRGDSEDTESQLIIPATTADAPTDLQVTRGNEEVTISWTAPENNGGSSIEYYTVKSSNGEIYKTSGTETTLVADGLTNGQSYRFTVSAHNDVSDGPESAQSDSVTPATIPDTPTNLLVIRDNGKVLVSWTAPVWNGGDPITNYEVVSNEGVSKFSSTTNLVFDGLENGKEYSFKVAAINTVGESEFTDESESIIPATIPDMPTGITTIPNDGSVTVSWVAPEWSGGDSVTGYKVTSSDGSTCTADANSTSCEVENLINGNTYTFTVTAINTVGESLTSDPSIETIPYTTPDSPKNVTVERGNSQVTVSWNAPTFDGGRTIDYYHVTTESGESCSTSGSSYSCVVTGLNNGDKYTFEVTAENIRGLSEPTTSEEIIPATVPDAPTSVTATRGNGFATVSWVKPAWNGGDAITEYEVISNDGVVQKVSGDSSSIKFADLENGKDYTFKVRAINTVGAGEYSEDSNKIIPATVPDSPTKVSVTRGNGQVEITWVSPSWDGGSPILNFDVISSDGTIKTSNSNQMIFDGLTNGTSYSFTVVARNSVGESAPSKASVSVIPATVPDAPENVTTTPQNGKVLVSWDAPVWNGGDPIKTYNVLSSNGESCSVSSSSTSCIVNNQSNGQSFTYTVQAVNTVGVSDPSSPSSVTIPYTVPNSPTGVTAAFGDKSATIRWNSPVFNGGRTVDSYTVKTVNETYTCNTDPKVDENSCIVEGLTNGKTYSFVVTAHNLAGDSVDSARSNAIVPATIPDAPTDIKVTRGIGQITVSWTSPTWNGGHSILSYQVKSTPDNKTCEVSRTDGNSCVVGGLENGKLYTFTVVAINDVGESAESEQSEGIIPAEKPGKPTNVTAVDGNQEVIVSWVAPQWTGGLPIDKYTVVSEDGKHSCEVDGTQNNCTVQGLDNGTEYKFYVYATNVVGDSENSYLTSPVTPATVPDSPTDVKANDGNKEVVVSWVAPDWNGGSTITQYVVTSNEGQTCKVSGDKNSCKITDLENGKDYSFSVIAINRKGESSPSVLSDAVTPATTPGAPTSVTAEHGNGEVSVEWIAPEWNGGSSITGYKINVSSKNFDKTYETDENASSFVVQELTNGTSYKVTVTAVNRKGDGISSKELEVIPSTVPGKPTDVKASVNSNGREITLVWNSPENTGGNAVSSYIVTGSNNETVCEVSKTNCVIKGLPQGFDYSFTVYAKNINGSGDKSESSNTVTLLTSPAAPIFAHADVTGNKEITVTWSDPVTDRWTSISGYRVYVQGETFESCETYQNSCVIRGLTPGRSYTFEVVSYNVVSSSSTLTNSVTAITLPKAPRNFRADSVAPDVKEGMLPSDVDYSIAISWQPPLDLNQGPVEDYIVTQGPSNSIVCATSSLNCIIDNLTPNTSYVFYITARNFLGNGKTVQSNTVYVKTAEIPVKEDDSNNSENTDNKTEGKNTETPDTTLNNSDDLASSIPVMNSNGSGNSNNSDNVNSKNNSNENNNEIHIKNVIDQPRNVKADLNGDIATITWDQVNGEVTGYIVYDHEGNIVCKVTDGKTQCSVKVDENKEYYFKVAAFYGDDEGILSNASNIIVAGVTDYKNLDNTNKLLHGDNWVPTSDDTPLTISNTGSFNWWLLSGLALILLGAGSYLFASRRQRN